jgi:hypothetical protein
MYTIDENDILEKIEDLPQSSIGAPIPMICCDEHTLYLAYYIQNTPDNWDGTIVKVVGPDTNDEMVSLVKFELCYSHMFGPPNDEAYTGHPLADRGLEPYSIFEVKNSSWIRQAAQRNSVHPYHKPDYFFKGKRHFLFFFHDTTFECIAKSMTYEIQQGSVKQVIANAIANIS